MTIKTFRGLITSGTQDIIRLRTNDGKIGYQIKKLQVITNAPTTVSAEAVIKIYSVPQTTITATIDFSDNELLAVALWTSASSSHTYPEDLSVVFDNMVFNQDIYVTHENSNTPYDPCNYYIELEQIKLDLNENTVATLKDIRNIQQPAV